MSNFQTRSAIGLILVMGLMTSPVMAAEAADSQAAGAQVDEPQPSTNWSNSGTGAPLFGNDSSVSAVQQSVTAGYELGGTGIAGGAAPAEGGIMTAAGRGRPIRFENGVFVYPSVLVGLGYNDNVTGRNTDRISSGVIALRPELVGELKHAGDRYTLSYVGNYAHYDSSSDDDYNHHEFWAAGDNYFTSRARLGWGVGYMEKSDPRGYRADSAAANSSEPDRWHAPVLRALGIYGAPGAIGRVELETSWMQKRYENNRSYTEQADVDLTVVSGRFFYRVMPRTSLVFEARDTWANYVSSSGSVGNNTDLRLYAGVTWDATAKTTGTIKVGRAYKDFSDSSRESSALNSWEGSVRWAPLTYSTFDLVTSRTPADSTGVGSFTTTTATSLVWNHKWASYISSRVSAGLVKTIYEANPREDNTKNYGVGFFTELGYRTRLGLDWANTDRNSNQDTNDFKRNVMMATLEFVL